MFPNNNTRTCCGGKMYEGYPNDCCGDVMYSPEESMSSSCCGGKMYPHTVNGWDCCAYSYPEVNGIWYNVNTQHCCEGKVESGAQGSGWAKCGEICFQPMTQSCCQGWDSNTNKSVIIVKQGKDSCCANIRDYEGYKCDPKTGRLININQSREPGVTWDEWSRRNMQADVNRALGFRPGYMGV
jgi:hypothetical protein